MDHLIKIDCRNIGKPITNNFKDYLNRHANFSNNVINKVKYDEKGIIDFDELLSINFPEIDKCDVFISYSHKDFEYAINVANEIERKTIHRCFIDELYWSSIKKIRDNLNSIRTADGTSYKTITERDEWAILGFSAQLLKIISECYYFIFIETANSVNKCGNICDRTSSPWLYFENRCANQLYHPPIKHSFDSITPQKIIPSYKLDLSKYKKMTLEEVVNNLDNPLF